MYVLKHRMTGQYVSKMPYHSIAARYCATKQEAETYRRYVDAFNDARANESVEEFA